METQRTVVAKKLKPKTIIKSYKPTPRQVLFHTAGKRNRLYGGAMGGGKSRALCEGAVMECLEFPGNFVFIGRRTLTDFMVSTYVSLTRKSTMLELVKNNMVSENRQQKFFSFCNGSRLFYGGLETNDSSGREKVFSTEFGSIFIDEAWEITQDQFMKLGSRLRHTLPDDANRFAARNREGKKLPEYHISLASNPSQNWIKERFIINPGEDDVFIPALACDNPYNPDDYEQTLRKLFRSDEKLVKAYVDGSWDAVSSVDELVGMDEVLQCIGLEVDSSKNRRVISCDPGRFGDDQTVIYCWHDAVVTKSFKFGKKDTMEIVGWILSLCKQMGDEVLVVVDETGTGAGIVDRLRENGVEVLGINFSARASEHRRFYNKRSEMYWNMRLAVRNKTVCVPDDQGLIAGLCGVKYRFYSDGRLILEPKDELKKRLGKSPDEADCFVLGLEGLAQYACCGKVQAEPVWMADSMAQMQEFDYFD